MSDHDHASEDKRQRALARLREQFGKVRIDEPREVDNFEAIATFLRLADVEAGEAEETDERPNMREQLRTVRRRRRELRAEQSTEIDQSDEDEIQAIDITEIIRDLPRVRDSIGNWLSRVDGDFVPSDTPLAELERYLEDVQFRMKVLTVWSRATRQELDDLQGHIQARTAAGKN